MRDSWNHWLPTLAIVLVYFVEWSCDRIVGGTARSTKACEKKAPDSSSGTKGEVGHGVAIWVFPAGVVLVGLGWFSLHVITGSPGWTGIICLAMVLMGLLLVACSFSGFSKSIEMRAAEALGEGSPRSRVLYSLLVLSLPGFAVTAGGIGFMLLAPQSKLGAPLVLLGSCAGMCVLSAGSRALPRRTDPGRSCSEFLLHAALVVQLLAATIAIVSLVLSSKETDGCIGFALLALWFAWILWGELLDLRVGRWREVQHEKVST